MLHLRPAPKVESAQKTVNLFLNHSFFFILIKHLDIKAMKIRVHLFHPFNPCSILPNQKLWNTGGTLPLMSKKIQASRNSRYVKREHLLYKKGPIYCSKAFSCFSRARSLFSIVVICSGCRNCLPGLFRVAIFAPKNKATPNAWRTVFFIEPMMY